MRTVSFVKRLEYEYHGNLFTSALVLGDCDNDQGNELMLGNKHGNLLVFKGSEVKPWRKAADLGMITCVEVGNICNVGKNHLVTLSIEGWCHIFFIKPDTPKQEGEGTGDGESSRQMTPMHRQHLPANSKVMLMADVDGDGKTELVVAYSDRVVRSFRWEGGEGDDPSQLTGKMVPLVMWQLAGQIGSITVNKLAGGEIDLMASQPGGTFVSLFENKKNLNGAEKTDSDSPLLLYHPLGSARLRSAGVTTELVGNICRHKKDEGQQNQPNYYALCTLDGTLMLIDNDKILWSIQLAHKLFALTKLDVTGDGTEEVVSCSWDGQTYILNHSREVVRFQFEEHVAAFCAGQYCTSAGNLPCLVYAAFNNRLYVYHQLHLASVETRDLLQVMGDSKGLHDTLAYFNVDASKPAEVRQLYEWCLYSMHPKSS